MQEASTIIAFGYGDLNAPRHVNTCNILREEGFEIEECHTVAHGLIGKYRDLRKRFRQIAVGKREQVLVTFPGHFIMPLAWWLTRFPRRKLIFDAFISLSDTDVSDRKRYSWFHPYAWFLYLVDFVTCHSADTIWIDTEEHKKFFAKRFFLHPKRIRVIYVGTREDLFFPASSQKREHGMYEIFFYGTYIPLQGIEYILDAAKLLEDHQDIHFTLIGKGQTYKKMQEKAQRLQLQNVTLSGPVPYGELPNYIRKADLCLGIFGTTNKAQRVIPHKVFDYVACGAKVITERSPAICELYEDGKEVILCNPGDGRDLADKILAIHG